MSTRSFRAVQIGTPRPVVNGTQLDPKDASRGYEMTRTHLSIDGRQWPKGTQYKPLSSGHNGALERYEQVVSIAGEPVMFTRGSRTYG